MSIALLLFDVFTYPIHADPLSEYPVFSSIALIIGLVKDESNISTLRHLFVFQHILIFPHF